ncbi:HlyD family secretion protein [Aneurinibacillus sp. REN35]|uniref:HlyD family secretion protein n=1 Tax=Aneurinibacillus sp. REN35 TaxID=3237286 RepID=UPI0035297461
MKRFFMVAVSVICVLGIVGGAAYYIIDRMNYVTTDNARLAADTVTIAPPSTGHLIEWSVRTGSQVQQGDILGIEMESLSADANQKSTAVQSNVQGQQGAAGTSQAANRKEEITSPITGTVLETHAIAKQMVQQGQILAMIADVSKPHIVAYIDEDHIRDVTVNKNVDVYLDAYPGSKFKGKVAQIGGTAGKFLTAQSAMNQQGNSKQSKQVERVPVKITVEDFNSKYVALGMNATIKIHK